MNRTLQLFLVLLAFIVPNGTVMINDVSAQPIVEIEIEPDIQKIYIKSEIQTIKLLAKTDKPEDLQFEWKLEGPGELKGDLTSPGIFYSVPEEISKVSVTAIVSVKVTDSDEKETIEKIKFTLVMFHIGDQVRIEKSVEKPCEGWQYVDRNEVGIVKKTNFRGKYVIVDFPSQADWIGCTEDLEIVTESQTSSESPESPSSPSESPKESKTILRLHGSDIIAETLASKLAEVFLMEILGATDVQIVKENPKRRMVIGKFSDKSRSIEIQEWSSSAAFTCLKHGQCEIGMSTRKITEEEYEELRFLGDMTSSENEHIIGLYGIAVLVNKENRVDKLSIAQVVGIFAGKITDWSELSGESGIIQIYTRDGVSEIHTIFESLLQKKIETPKGFSTRDELFEAIGNDVNGIGYTTIQYIDRALLSFTRCKTLAVSDEEGLPILPSKVTVKTEDYPLSDRLYLYTPSNLISDPYTPVFIGFVLSKRGQEIVQDAEFVNLNIQIEQFDDQKQSFIDEYRQTVKNPERLQIINEYESAIQGAKRLSLNFRFEFESYKLDLRSLQDITRIVKYLQEHSDKKVILIGFADTIGDYKSNCRLALKRAQTVVEEFRRYGITIQDENVISACEEFPVASNETPEGRQKNRRVEVWIK